MHIGSNIPFHLNLPTQIIHNKSSTCNSPRCTAEDLKPINVASIYRKSNPKICFWSDEILSYWKSAGPDQNSIPVLQGGVWKLIMLNFYLNIKIGQSFLHKNIQYNLERNKKERKWRTSRQELKMATDKALKFPPKAASRRAQANFCLQGVPKSAAGQRCLRFARGDSSSFHSPPVDSAAPRHWSSALRVSWPNQFSTFLLPRILLAVYLHCFKIKRVIVFSESFVKS